ncbi:AMP-binding protein [Streptomyces sp. XM83C]|uniref:AMP-binding protein n=1 Tax=Streptomyces sp. XM83C TaxID=2929781 RepID=UPI001FF7856D|nr:AMP-binding protein [Streptomyces sp. XM83C]MCK1821619.1 AMP-binding protein [Streptomyces sp. XM83C]
MGRPAFQRFLTSRHIPAGRAAAVTGVRWGGDFAAWDDLLAAGRDTAPQIRPGGAYAVDPAAGPSALAALFAVAVVPETVLLWASPAGLGITGRRIAPALHELPEGAVPFGAEQRPLWGVCTSGSSGTPKVAVGHADEWEQIALHAEAAMYADAFPEGPPEALATCLPLGFSAAFFMCVLPALYLKRDLVIHPPYDWSPLYELARERRVLALGVPALAAAACLSAPPDADLSRVALYLGGGHLSAPRVELIRRHFTGAHVSNLYGTAETGAIALDHDPGHNEHVGRPVPGKAVWLTGTDERGIGTVAVAGPGCCRRTWRPGGTPSAPADHVTGTDYGRFDSDGNLCLEGRVDGAEKLAGVLVRPREIERHILALHGVSDVRVTVETAPNGLEHLAATVVGAVGPDTVRAHCADLPEQHRPSRIRCTSEQEAASVYSSHGKL